MRHNSTNIDPIQKAIEDMELCEEGASFSYRKVAKRFGISYRTLARRLEFSDGDAWIVRVQKTTPSADSFKRLLHEVCTIRAIQQRSNVPIPRMITYRTAEDNPVRAAFTIQQYVHADTAMNVLGERFSRKTQMTAGWEERYYGAMARIQVTITYS